MDARREGRRRPRASMLTAKHHDGFCLWPTRTTDALGREESVARRSGRRRSRARRRLPRRRAARRPLSLAVGSQQPDYGDSPRYNDLYCEQLTELLTRYGTIAEVWFDGANGEGPNGKQQIYDWPRVWALVRRLQPEAVMFSDAGPDVRWCGNERGTAGDPNWSTVDPAIVPYPGADGPGIIDVAPARRSRRARCGVRRRWMSRFGPAGSIIRPRMRACVRSTISSNLYFTSVGRNGKLLLNVPPTRDGLIHSTDVARLTDFRERLTTLFGRDVASDAKETWRVTGARSAMLDIELSAATRISAARLEEDITRGQRVAAYRLEADRPLSRGTTIGFTKLDRFPEATTRRVRLVIETVDAPERPVVKLYA